MTKRGHAHVWLRGDVLRTDVSALRRDLRSVMALSHCLELDLHDVTYLERSAAQELASYSAQLDTEGLSVVLKPAPGPVVQVLDEVHAFAHEGGTIIIDAAAGTRDARMATVMQFYDALADGDYARIERLLTQTVLWRTPAIVTEGIHRGRAEVLAFLNGPGALPGMVTLARRAVHVRGLVIVRGTHQVAGRPSQPVHFRHAWRVTDGGLDEMVEQIDAGAYTDLADTVHRDSDDSVPGWSPPGPAA